MRVVSFLRCVSSSVLCAALFSAGSAAQADPPAQTPADASDVPWPESGDRLP